MDKNKKSLNSNVDNEKHICDPAGGCASGDDFLPGQIPVAGKEPANARETEQQPDPVQAEAAVNPTDMAPPGKTRKQGGE